MSHRRTFAAGLQPFAHSELSALRRAPIRRRRIGRCLRWPATPAPGARATPRSTSAWRPRCIEAEVEAGVDMAADALEARGV